MKAHEFDLEDVTVKKDTVIIDFNTDSGTVNLQVSRESLLTYIGEFGLDCDLETYLTENLRDVVKEYLQDNL